MTRWILLALLCLVTAAGADAPKYSERVTKALAAIKKVDEFHFELPRAAAKVLVEDRSALAGVQWVQHVTSGKPRGLKVSGIQPASMLGRLGWQNDDILIQVNNDPVTDEASLREIIKKLGTSLADSKTREIRLAVTVSREGLTASVMYRIQ